MGYKNIRLPFLVERLCSAFKQKLIMDPFARFLNRTLKCIMTDTPSNRKDDFLSFNPGWLTHKSYPCQM